MATACVLVGFHAACNKGLRDVDCLIAAADKRETVLGAERAKDLRENMMGDMVVRCEEEMVDGNGLIDGVDGISSLSSSSRLFSSVRLALASVI